MTPTKRRFEVSLDENYRRFTSGGSFSLTPLIFYLTLCKEAHALYSNLDCPLRVQSEFCAHTVLQPCVLLPTLDVIKALSFEWQFPNPRALIEKLLAVFYSAMVTARAAPDGFPAVNPCSPKSLDAFERSVANANHVNPAALWMAEQMYNTLRSNLPQPSTTLPAWA